MACVRKSLAFLIVLALSLCMAPLPAFAAADADLRAGSADFETATMAAASTQGGNGFVVVLDPGHGGYDGGATGIGFYEKDANLAIAQYCKAKLEQTPGITVYMTRTDDTFVSLSDRTKFAVEHNADLVVSVHNNAGDGKGSGSEVIVPRDGAWYHDETYLTGTELGTVILAKLNALGLGTHNGVYSRDCTTGEMYPDGTLSDYYSLIDGPRSNGILGIIVEHAFVDSETDAAFLRDDANLKRLGEADAEAIVEYYNSSQGIDRQYWGVYSQSYYFDHYADAKAECGTDKLQALAHFKSVGMAEGRRGNVLFDANYYKANNEDLQKAYGDDMPQYYRHFLKFGMAEGRQSSAEFSPSAYRAAYADLEAAFGDDWKKYYRHYIEFGISEGRSGVPSVSPAANVTVYRLYSLKDGEHLYTTDKHERSVILSWGNWRDEGVAWVVPDESSTPVYRLYDMNTGEHHYTTDKHERDTLVSWGNWRDEGIAWYSDDNKALEVYRLQNSSQYPHAHHYTLSAKEKDVCINEWGWKSEGIGWYALEEAPAEAVVAQDDEAIMGVSQTSVSQMVRRYNAMGKAYPSAVYSQYGAASIDQFCQILYEEAAAEGVRAEVVFAQAMHETGWLQFGGDVKAEQCNFAGIGATGGGNPGNSFNDWGANSVRKGLRAQVQHLKAYASTDGLNNETVDPRFTYVTRGCAPTVQALGGRWAVGSGYGDALVTQVRSLLAA